MNAPWVVMRSKNDAGLIGATLEAVRSQTVPCRILNIDSGSTDGTTAIIRRFTDRLIEIPPGEYVPGRVLNRGMEETSGEVVVFLNADATPADRLWLENLLAPMAEARRSAGRPRAAGVSGRRIRNLARPEFLCNRSGAGVPGRGRTQGPSSGGRRSAPSATAARRPGGSTSSPWPRAPSGGASGSSGPSTPLR